MTIGEKTILDLVDADILRIKENGKIYRIKNGRLNGSRKPTKCKPRLMNHKLQKGYIQIQVGVGNGKVASAMAHRLVWIYFNGTIPEGMEVNHKKGIRDDNRPSELEVMTSSQNMRHAIDVLKIDRNKKLNRNDVKEILRLKKEENIGCVKISRIFNVSKQAITYILKNNKNGKDSSVGRTNCFNIVNC